jgi:signal peptidase I
MLRRYKRLLTPGHAIAALVVMGAIYFAWASVMPEGGTGSNVVLGLLVAIVALWMGTTALAPQIDDLLGPKAKAALRKRRRFAHDIARDLENASARERKNKTTSLTSDVFARIDAAIVALDAAAASTADSDDDLLAAEVAAREVADVFPKSKETPFTQARSLGFAFAIAIALRTFAVAPFQIPSGSMIPTLLIGDHLFVWRATYGLQIPSRNGLGRLAKLLGFLPEKPFYFVRWSTPSPGDVVVFEAPPWVGMNSGEDWIKRVIAGPGQTVKFEGTVLTVDGRTYSQEAPDGRVGTDEAGYPFGEMTRYVDYDERLNSWFPVTGNHKVEKLVDRDGTVRPHSIYNDMPPPDRAGAVDWPAVGVAPHLPGLRCTDTSCVVEDGYVFVMGDNRDHSSDGRTWGAVPIDNVKGQAIFIWVSVDGSENSLKLGRFTLPRFRLERLGQIIR